MKLINLVKRNKIQTIKDTIKLFNINEKDKHGKTALFYVKSVEVAKILLEYGININEVDDLNQTPLFTAHTPEIANFIIECGVDANALDFSEKTALFYTQNHKIADVLIKNRIDINHCDRNGRNALMRSDIPYKTAKLLVMNGIDINKKDFCDRNALFYTDSCRIIKLYIDNGMNAFQLSKIGETVLFYEKSYNALLFLLNLGVDIYHLNIFGEDALHSSIFSYFYKKSFSINKGIDEIFIKKYKMDLFSVTSIFSTIINETSSPVIDVDPVFDSVYKHKLSETNQHIIIKDANSGNIHIFKHIIKTYKNFEIPCPNIYDMLKKFFNEQSNNVIDKILDET